MHKQWITLPLRLSMYELQNSDEVICSHQLPLEAIANFRSDGGEEPKDA
jgi:hypothetical protein